MSAMCVAGNFKVNSFSLNERKIQTKNLCLRNYSLTSFSRFFGAEKMVVYRKMSKTLYREVSAALLKKAGYNDEEVKAGADHQVEIISIGQFARSMLKLLHMHEALGPDGSGCWVQGAKLERTSQEGPREVYNANGQFGPLAASRVAARVIEQAKKYGIGVCEVVGATHLICDPTWALKISSAGYKGTVIGTSGTPEATPLGGTKKTIGPNPISVSYPTKSCGALEFDMMYSWSTTGFSSGKTGQYKLEGKKLPDGFAIDEDGNNVNEPDDVYALTFGPDFETAKKLCGLGLGIEVDALFAGGNAAPMRGTSSGGTGDGIPRSYWKFMAEVPTATFGELPIPGDVPIGENVGIGLAQIMAPNPDSHIPGAGTAKWAKRTEEAGALLFPEPQIAALQKLLVQYGVDDVSIPDDLETVEYD